MIHYKRSLTSLVLLLFGFSAWAQSITSDTLSANRLFELGLQSRAKSNFHDAHIHFAACDKLLKKHFDYNHPARLKSSLQLANNQKQLGDYTNALHLYQDILKVLDQQTNEDDYVQIQHHIGSIYKDLFDTHNAQETFEWILQNRINRFGKNHPKVVSAYIKLAANCNDFQDSLHYQLGLQYLHTALSIQEQLDGKKGDAYYYIQEEISEIYRSMGKNREAIVLLKEVLKHRQATRKRSDVNLGDAHFYLVKNYLQTQEWEKAFYHINQDLEILSFSMGARHHFVANNLRDKAYIFRMQKKYPKALAAIQEAIQLLVPSFDASDRRQLNSALSEVGHVQQLALIRMFREEAEILLEQTIPNKMLALQSLESAISLVEEVRQVQLAQGSKIALQANNSNIFEKAIALSLDLWESAQDRIYFEKAFLIMEKSKVATLREALTAKSAFEFTNIPEEIAEKISFLKSRIGNGAKRKYDLQKETADNAKEVEFINNQLFDLKLEYNQLMTSIEKEYPKYYDLKYNNNIISLRSAQSLMTTTNAQLLEYFIGENQIYTFHITGDFLAYRISPLPPDFNQRSVDFINQIKNSQLAGEQGNSKTLFQQFTEQSHSYHQLLLSKLSLREDQRLLIIPDGILNLLPFDLLIKELPAEFNTVDYSSLAYLLRDHPISYEYALSLHQDYQQNGSAKPKGLVAFAPTYENNKDLLPKRTGFSDLKFTEQEVQQIADLSNGDIYLKEQATEQKFKKIVEHYDIIHLAMHAFTDDQNPTYSGLIFSEQKDEEDDILHAYELSNMNLNANLAVLSACNTGHGKLVGGEGVMSLARAFRSAGCPNILMSLWQADDEATQGIMLDFYQQLKKGLPKDEAIRQAKLEYLNTQQKTYPYYWSSFVLLGDAAPIDLGRSFPWTWIFFPFCFIGLVFLVNKYL